MPIYEYVCPACQQGFELLMRGNEAASCPTCGNGQVERQLSVPSAHTGGRDLPVYDQPSGGCGLPECGSGGCQFG